MTLDNDTIQIDSKQEISALMDMIDKYINAYPNDKNPSAKRLYDILDAMDMSW